MEAWMMVGLNYMRALRHPFLVSDLQRRDVYPHGPARAILSQPALPRLRSFGRGPPRDPSPQRAPLSLQTLWADLHRDQRHRLLPDAQTDVKAIADRFELEALRGEFTDAAMMHDYDRFASLFTRVGAWR